MKAWSELRLSDAFEVPEDSPELELKVLVLNINDGFNEGIKEQCRTLKEYMQYVNRVRRYAATVPLEEAVERAVTECIEEDILRDFLKKHGMEVRNMIWGGISEEEYKRMQYEEGLEDGEIRGKAKFVIELLESLEPVPEELKERILAQKDMEVLKNWHICAARANSIAEWKEKVDPIH